MNNNYFNYRNFAGALIDHSRELGMRLEEPVSVEFQQRGQPNDHFFKGLVKKHKNLELIMVILPRKGAGYGYGVCIDIGTMI